MRKGSAEYFRQLERLLEQMQRQIGVDPQRVDDGNIPAIATAQTDATTAIANAATAQTQADLSGYTATGMNFVWHTDDTGTQPPNNDTRDLIATFYDEDGTSIATRTLRGTYTTAADTIAVTAQATSGEATTYSLTDDGTASVLAEVEHTASRTRMTLSWSFVDETVAGGIPAGGAGK